MSWQWFRRLLTLATLITFTLFLLSILVLLQNGIRFNAAPHISSTSSLEIGTLASSQRLYGATNDIHYIPEDEYDPPRLPGESKRLPSCIIIGARKCGTRALLEFLNLHPDIRTAKFELHFFNKNHIYAEGYEWYRRRMPYSLAHHVTIEKTPGYFISAAAPERIYRMNPNIRLLLIVREPVKRTVSDYTQVQMTKAAKGKPRQPLERMAIDQSTGHIRSAYKPVRNSLYYKHIQLWLKYFSLSSIHIVDGDRFAYDPFSELRKVEDFLSLKHKIDSRQLYYNNSKGFYCYRHPREGAKCLGETKGRPHVSISQEVKEKLEVYFAPFNRLFFELTNRTFDWKVEKHLLSTPEEFGL